jgi:hypothetical protein
MVPGEVSMSRSIRLAVRLLVIVALLAGFSAVFNDTPSTSTPYVSALSDLVGSPALAAAGCKHTICHLQHNGRYECVKVDQSRLINCVKSGGACTTVEC